MDKLSFIKQYIMKPRTVGAIAPSSRKLAQKMVEDIDFDSAEYIIEYGPGTGAFTEELLRNRNKNTKILLIEYNYRFYNMLVGKYGNMENMYIINDSAENIEMHLNKLGIPYADYIVSGLPFASLPEEVSCSILANTKRILRTGGRFITFQYTLLKKGFISGYFKSINIKREFRNIPPAYVFNCGI